MQNQMDGMNESLYPEETDSAEQRLLEAAKVLFSEKGFEATSIRDITQMAGCNIAAVNYHFGSKEKLYTQLMQKHMDWILQVRIDCVDAFLAEEGGGLEDFLRAFARAFFDPFQDRAQARQLMNLLHREMTDPKMDPGIFMERFVEPHIALFQRAFERLCPELDDTQVFLCVHSFMAQLIHVARMQNLYFEFRRAFEDRYPNADMVEHVVRFTAAGIGACRKGDI